MFANGQELPHHCHHSLQSSEHSVALQRWCLWLWKGAWIELGTEQGPCWGRAKRREVTMGRLPRHLRHFFSSVGELGLKFHVNVTMRSGLATSVSTQSRNIQSRAPGGGYRLQFCKKVQESARNEMHNSHQYHFSTISGKYSFFFGILNPEARGQSRGLYNTSLLSAEYGYSIFLLCWFSLFWTQTRGGMLETAPL